MMSFLFHPHNVLQIDRRPAVGFRLQRSVDFGILGSISAVHGQDFWAAGVRPSACRRETCRNLAVYRLVVHINGGADESLLSHAGFCRQTAGYVIQVAYLVPLVLGESEDSVTGLPPPDSLAFRLCHAPSP